MTIHIRRAAVGVAALWLSCGLAACTPQAQPATPGTRAEERAVRNRASGTFEVKLTLMDPDAATGGVPGRMSIDKQFKGDLQGSSKGQMLAAMTGVEGSAGYVAIEQVTGTLAGRGGTFVLQHSGIMNRGAPTLTITVVPDSGTGELTGLKGTMTIDIANGQHSYTFDYTLPAASR
jgi:Protein of unknown function (DUF3224)